MQRGSYGEGGQRGRGRRDRGPKGKMRAKEVSIDETEERREEGEMREEEVDM